MNPRRRATERATVLLPDPPGPSIATIKAFLGSVDKVSIQYFTVRHCTVQRGVAPQPSGVSKMRENMVMPDYIAGTVSAVVTLAITKGLPWLSRAYRETLYRSEESASGSVFRTGQLA